MASPRSLSTWHGVFAANRAWSKKVLIIDLDPQFNASQYALGVERYKSLLESGKPPSQLELSFSLRNPIGKEMRLVRLVKSIEEDYDVVLIDCAPTESMLTTAAYLSSDWILVPVKPNYLSTIGLPLLASSMRWTLL